MIKIYLCVQRHFYIYRYIYIYIGKHIDIFYPSLIRGTSQWPREAGFKSSCLVTLVEPTRVEVKEPRLEPIFAGSLVMVRWYVYIYI